MPAQIPSSSRRPVAPGVTTNAPRPVATARPGIHPVQKHAGPVKGTTPPTTANPAPRPTPLKRPSAKVQGAVWDINKYKSYWEDQVAATQELLEVKDDRGAKETLTATLKRLQQGCRQFESHPMMLPMLKCITTWTEDVRKRLDILQAGGSFSSSSNNAASPVAAETSNTANIHEIDALVEATVPARDAQCFLRGCHWYREMRYRTYVKPSSCHSSIRNSLRLAPYNRGAVCCCGGLPAREKRSSRKPQPTALMQSFTTLAPPTWCPSGWGKARSL